jgi:hypothetical protein
MNAQKKEAHKEKDSRQVRELSGTVTRLLLLHKGCVVVIGFLHPASQTCCSECVFTKHTKYFFCEWTIWYILDEVPAPSVPSCWSYRSFNWCANHEGKRVLTASRIWHSVGSLGVLVSLPNTSSKLSSSITILLNTQCTRRRGCTGCLKIGPFILIYIRKGCPAVRWHKERTVFLSFLRVELTGFVQLCQLAVCNC